MSRCPASGAHAASGFTLIELMVGLIIVGIVASLAIPAYQGILQRGKRADAYAGLAATADALELDYNNQAPPRSYSDDFGTLGVPDVSPEGYYDLSVHPCSGGSLVDCYEVRATARVDGPQSGDTSCRVLMTDSLGRRDSSPDPANCWRD